ncbi:MAG: 1-acyl-sn-glycerol-3-phosphate acyltransferase [Bacilli bacterium]|nr:1-acyl-sn-glycerol-3-phosphate acyltransferase [Bacilli bacterium]MBO4682911.1 1-acyl-sn-glycerol-3-phosphate acyltransferase [Bacilli bacterium]
MFLEFIILGLAVANAIVAPLTYWKIVNWWDFYIPIVMFVATYIVALLLVMLFLQIMGMILLFVHKKMPNNKLITHRARFFLKNGLALINFHSNIKVKTKGLAKLPKNERFLLVCNHRSNYDPMISIVELMRYQVDFITKDSNMRIPIGGNYLKTLNFLPVDRNDPMQSLQMMNKAVQLIQDDVCSIGVYPEGTRGHTDKMLPFHEGVFNIALKAECPIVIATVKNTDQIKKNAPFRRTKVFHDIVTVIPYEEIEGKTAKAVSALVRDIMENNLRRYEQQ